MKLSATSANADGEHVLDLGVDRLDHPRQLASCAAHVLELLFEERVPLLELVELLERQRVDRPQEAQLAFEFADTPGRRRALGQHGHRCRLGDRRFDVEVASQGLDRGLEPQLRLGLLELGPPGPLADSSSAAPSRAARPAELVELGGQPAHLVALAAALLDEVGVQHLDDLTVAGDEPRRAGRSRRCRARSSTRCPSAAGPRLDVGRQPSLGLGETLLEQLLTLVQAGVADLEVLAARRQRRRPRLELGPQLAAGPRGIGLGLLVGLQRRQQRLEFGDPLSVAVDVGRRARRSSARGSPARRHLAMLALRPRQALGGGAEAGVVGVESASQLGLGRSGRLQRSVGGQRRASAARCESRLRPRSACSTPRRAPRRSPHPPRRRPAIR